MTDKEQIIIDGVKEKCEILFECGSVDDLASYDMIKKNIKITPENAPVDDYDIRLIANPQSPYGFTSIFKRNKNVDEWEYMGFGHSGACSVVTALLKRLVRKTQECEKLKEKIKQVKDFKDKVINQLKDENDRNRKALALFQDEYFKGLDTTTIAELAKKSIRLTTENRKLETALDEIEEMLQVIVKSNKVYPLQSNLYKILNIISKAKGEENAR